MVPLNLTLSTSFATFFFKQSSMYVIIRLRVFNSQATHVHVALLQDLIMISLCIFGNSSLTSVLKGITQWGSLSTGILN